MGFRYEIRGEPDNYESIAATLCEYRVRPGIHRVPISALDATFSANFYAVGDRRRVDALKERVQKSGWVSPLIVVYDAEGPYVLEGAHRLVALGELGALSVPALIVDDLERSNPRTHEGKMRRHKKTKRRNPPRGANDPALFAAWQDATRILGRPPRIGGRP
jgi:hypothetical protein